MNNLERQKIIKSLPNIPIQNVLDLYDTKFEGSRFRITSAYVDNGAFEIREGEKARKEKSDLNANGEYWRDHKSDKYGTGAFQLLAYLEGLDVMSERDKVLSKLKELLLDDNYQLDEGKIESNRKSYTANLGLGNNAGQKEEFIRPQPYKEYLHEGIAYLNEKRGIPVELLKRSLDYEDGKIYVTKTLYNDKRVVFLGKLNSEERSIYGDFKGAGKGSNRDLSGFEVGADENSLVFETFVDENGEEYESIKKGTGYFALTEAAIDALSYNALFPDRYVASSNGCGNFKFQYLKTTGYIDSDMDISIRVAFDADEAGDEAAQKLFNAIFVRKYFFAQYERELKEHFKSMIKPDDPNGWKKGFDEWILSGKINLNFEDNNSNRSKRSPHLMFFNYPYYQEKYPLYEKKDIEEEFEYEDNYGQKKIGVRRKKSDPVLVGEECPQVFFTVHEDIQNLLKMKSKNCNFNIKGQTFEKMIKVMVRERPIVEKDWNEVLKKQGIAYLTEYSRLFKQGFKENGQIVFPKLDDTRSPVSFYRERDIRNGDIAKHFNVEVKETEIRESKAQQQSEQHQLHESLHNYLVQFNQRKARFKFNDDLQSLAIPSMERIDKEVKENKIEKENKNKVEKVEVVKNDMLNNKQILAQSKENKKRGFASMAKGFGKVKTQENPPVQQVDQEVEAIFNRQQEIQSNFDEPPIESYMDDYYPDLEERDDYDRFRP